MSDITCPKCGLVTPSYDLAWWDHEEGDLHCQVIASLRADRDAWKQQAEGVNRDLLDALAEVSQVSMQGIRGGEQPMTDISQKDLRKQQEERYGSGGEVICQTCKRPVSENGGIVRYTCEHFEIISQAEAHGRYVTLRAAVTCSDHCLAKHLADSLGLRIVGKERA